MPDDAANLLVEDFSVDVIFFVVILCKTFDF